MGASDPAEEEELVLSRSGPVARILFNRPARRNAMTLRMWGALHRALLSLADDDAVRVIVLAGAGGAAFVSGADIGEFDRLRATPEGVAEYNRVSDDAETALYQCPKPTIAEIDGFCMGGGLGIAVACDLRIASTRAQFGIPAGRLGLAYGYDSVARLVALLGPSVAAEILFTAVLLPAERAQNVGLLNAIVAPELLGERVAATAAQIAANAPMTLRAAKAAIGAATAASVDRTAVEALIAACYASADYAEGRRAFAERRAPRFVGR